MGRAGLEQSSVWAGQEGRAPVSSSPTRRAPRTHFHPRRAPRTHFHPRRPQGHIFIPGEPRGAQSKVGLGVRAGGSKAEVAAVVPSMVQEQLWEKLELVSLLQSTAGAVMSPSVLQGRWAVPLRWLQGTVGALEGGGSTQPCGWGRSSSSGAFGAPFGAIPVAGAMDGGMNCASKGSSPAPVFSCRAQ